MGSLTVIVPVLDEEEGLARLLPRLATQASQVIVVDGGSRDRSREVARAVPGVELMQAPPPRSSQMNAGAATARGDVLLFLHGDARPPDGFAGRIHAALEDPRVVGGAFDLAIDDGRPAARLVAWGASLRSRLTRCPYGDQGLFVRHRVFRRLGGYAPLDLLEDLDFAYRLRRLGKIRLLPQAVTVSARRWQAHGYWRTTCRHTILAACFYLGISTEPLAHWMRPVRQPRRPA